MARKKFTEFNMSNILSAAEELFSEKGMEETSMDDIARLANYSKSTVYVYFKSKEDIYNHVVLEYLKCLYEKVLSLTCGTGSFEKTYFSICDAICQAYERNPSYFAYTLGPSRPQEDKVTDESLRLICATGERMNDAITGFLRRGIAEGVLREDMDPAVMELTMWASISGSIAMAYSKEAYIRSQLRLTKKQYLKNAYSMLLTTIQKETTSPRAAKAFA